MIRVLHFADPGEARRRIEFLGATAADADRVVSALRAFLIGFPLEAAVSRGLPDLLRRKGIPHAKGSDVLLFSVSSEDLPEPGRGSAHGGEGDPLSAARAAIDRYGTREFTLRCRDRSLPLSGVPRIMGVLNVTPDSFSDGGQHYPADRAVERGRELAEEGADIIDVGGESTRPGSKGVPAAVELERVIPVLRGLRESGALLSVDTTKAEVAAQAAEAGAHIVNDTSALAGDPGMARVVRDSGCAVVLMHRRGTPESMQEAPSYRSLFDEVLAELAERVEAAKNSGIPPDRILVDPGIGFGKRHEDNLALHRHLADLRNLGMPVLFGSSRKSFLGRITGRDPGERAFGTAASAAVAVLGGAHVVRVHDVKEMKDAIRVAAAVVGGDEC